MLSYVFVLKFYFLEKNVVLDITEQKQKNLKFQ